MLWPVKRPRRPGDFAQRAKLIVDMATGSAPRDPEPQPDSPVTLARRKAGRQGGPARAKKLPAERRTQIARRAAKARWSKPAQ